MADFNRQEFAQLNDRYASPVDTPEQLSALYDLTAGQPYLSRKAFYLLCTQFHSVDKLIAASLQSDGPFSDDLQAVWYRLSQDKKLTRSMKQVLTNSRCDQELEFQRLRWSGLVSGKTENDVKPRRSGYRPAGFLSSGRALRPDLPSYVVRAADTDFLSAVTRGEFCYVLTPRQMGKTSLMARTVAALQGHTATVVIDLTQIGAQLSADEWYFGLARFHQSSASTQHRFAGVMEAK